MKIKKLIIFIISIILIYIPTQSFAWLEYSTYEKTNIITAIIAFIMKILAFIIGISYVTISMQYLKHSNQDKWKKIKNILVWLVIVVVEIVFFIGGALLVNNIGIETYWTSGERFQFNKIDGYISNGIRIVALVLMIMYLLISSIYFIKSKKEKINKTSNIIKWQVIISAIIAGLLILATRW